MVLGRRRALSLGHRPGKRGCYPIKALDTASPSEQREAYARLDALIRDHARQTTGIAAEALTPSELPGAIIRPDRARQLEQIQTLLAECERAKYAPQPPDPERCGRIRPSAAGPGRWAAGRVPGRAAVARRWWAGRNNHQVAHNG